MKNNSNSIAKKVLFALFVVFAFNLSSAFAAGNFDQGIAEATSQISGYITTISGLVMAIGGVVGVIGGIRIYNKWNNGDQDINKELLNFGGSAVFLILAPVVIRTMFGQ